jgi:hypothetical protein
MAEEEKTEVTETAEAETQPETEAAQAEAPDTPDKKMPSFAKPLDKMTVPELKEVAMDIPGVTGVSAMKKAELLDLIKEYWEIEDEETQKQAQKPVATIKNIKEKIVQLREEKESAREAKDRNRVDILRRRINRLKKQTRKVARG